jgi:RNA polymerase sigma-70 factor (ECF subfamily)
MSDLSLAYPLETGVTTPAVALEESAWVQRAREGDLDAFDAIMLRYEVRLLRFLTGLVGDVEVARELCQDTFLAAFRGLPGTRGELKLSAWLHTIALNRARSFHRRRRLRSFLPLDDSYAAKEDTQESVVLSDSVRRVMRRLPDKYAQVLLLQVVSGLSCKEIAEIVGCSEGAVKVRLLRAREIFRRLYREEERGG